MRRWMRAPFSRGLLPLALASLVAFAAGYGIHEATRENPEPESKQHQRALSLPGPVQVERAPTKEQAAGIVPSPTATPRPELQALSTQISEQAELLREINQRIEVIETEIVAIEPEEIQEAQGEMAGKIAEHSATLENLRSELNQNSRENLNELVQKGNQVAEERVALGRSLQDLERAWFNQRTVVAQLQNEISRELSLGFATGRLGELQSQAEIERQKLAILDSRLQEMRVSAQTADTIGIQADAWQKSQEQWRARQEYQEQAGKVQGQLQDLQTQYMKFSERQAQAQEELAGLRDRYREATQRYNDLMADRERMERS